MDKRLASRHRPCRTSRRATDEERKFLELLHPDTVAAVRQVMRDYRRLVDDLLHYSTGFVLEEGGKRRLIAVDVDTVLPDCIAEFVARRCPVNTSYGGGSGPTLLDGLEAELSVATRRRTTGAVTHHPAEIVQKNGDWLRDCRFDGVLAEFSEDVLGEYDHHHHRIFLHGLVIGMVSEVLGLDVESLALVVLIHEYAHAYTHLGKDIDDNFWLTEDYEKLDMATKEGLAQFYTAHLCHELDGFRPNLRATFDHLLRVQHAVYRQYQVWPCQEPHIGECVRMAIINARKRRIASEQEFRVCLDEARRVLS